MGKDSQSEFYRHVKVLSISYTEDNVCLFVYLIFCSFVCVTMSMKDYIFRCFKGKNYHS